jgi:hypothetical protein
MKDVNITLKQAVESPEMRKNLVNYVLDKSGTSGDVRMSLRNMLMNQFDVMAQKTRTTPASKKEQVLGSLFGNALKEEFSGQQIDKVLKDYVTGIAPTTPAKPSTKISIRDIVKTYNQKGKFDQAKMIDEIVTKSGLTGESANKLKKQLDARFLEARNVEKKKAIEAHLKEKKIKEPNPTKYVDRLVEMSNTGVLYNDRVKSIIAEKYGIPELTTKDMKEILKKMDEYAAITDTAAKEEKYEEVLTYIANKFPKDLETKVRTWSKMFMLSLPSTHFANEVGNFTQRNLLRVADRVSGIAESIMKVPATERRHSRITKADADIVAEAEKSFNEHKHEFERAGGKIEVPTQQSLIKKYQDTFETKALNKYKEGVFGLLTKRDMNYFKPAYIEAVSRFMKARGTTQMSKEAHEYGIAKAEYATFRRVTAVSKILSDLKNKTGALGTAVDVRIPFVNTAINILDSAVDFSPLGFIKAGAKAIAKNKYSKADVADQLGKSVTGTALLTSVGMLLQAIGVIDYDEKDGTTVSILGSKYTIDWLQPAAMSLTFGAAAMKQMMKEGISIDAIVNGFRAGVDSLGRNTIIEEIRTIMGEPYQTISESLESIPMEAAQQAYPTPLGAIARSIDPKMRSTYTPDTAPLAPVQRFVKGIAAKTPGLSMLLPERVDALGNTMKQENAIGQIALPGRIVPQSTGEIADNIRALQNVLKKDDPELAAKLTLKVAPAKWVEDKKPVILDSNEYEQFSKELGKKRSDALKQLMASGAYITSSDEEKANKILKKIETVTAQVKKNFK